MAISPEDFKTNVPAGKVCSTCKHFSCICRIKLRHTAGCKFLIAATGPFGIECEHGRDVCPKCDPCTCEAPS